MRTAVSIDRSIVEESAGDGATVARDVVSARVAIDSAPCPVVHPTS